MGEVTKPASTHHSWESQLEDATSIISGEGSIKRSFITIVPFLVRPYSSPLLLVEESLLGMLWIPQGHIGISEAPFKSDLKHTRTDC